MPVARSIRSSWVCLQISRWNSSSRAIPACQSFPVSALAGRFYLSRYYLMHRFKAVTGYTIHQYISQKRLLRAGELIREGMPVMKAAEQVGFSEYSTFLRAFRNTFHMNPREFR